MDRKTILAIVIVGIIILLTPYYYKLVMPDAGVQPTAPVDSAASQVLQDPGYNETPATEAPRSAYRESQRDDGGADRPWFAADPPSQAETVTVETPRYTAVFSTRGATIQSWKIKPTQPYLIEEEELVRGKYAGRNLTLVARGGRGLLRTEEKNFTANRAKLTLTEGERPQSITFTLPLEGDSYYSETYTFHPDRYIVDVMIESKGLGDLTGSATATFGWGGGMNYTEADTAQDNFYTNAMFLMGKTKETLKSNGKKVDEEVATGPTNWVAQRTKYFMVALIPETPATGARLATWPDSSYTGKHLPKLYETSLVFDLYGSDTFRKNLTMYIGPLEQGKIQRVDPTLEETMSWGWVIIEPFSKLVFWALVNIHKIIPNYGVVLILFSILVKVLVWPLTAKSYKSMKRMQKIQPILKATQEKYKDNPQKMQQEVMALYKVHKVNPMGGCWPTLLQMPLLYGLFIVFRSTIELRGQPFVLWITDLSMPDALINLPFNIPLYGSHIALLPIIMAVSTYLQSRQTASSDPNQKMMTTMMPIMFIFLFNNFPSGLTLYYTLFNLLSVAQQRFLKVSDPQLDKELEEVEKEQERIQRRKERKNRG